MKNILTLLAGAILLAGPAFAQTADVAGTWDVNFNTPNGPIAAALTLKKDGEKLSGSIAGCRRSGGSGHRKRRPCRGTPCTSGYRWFLRDSHENGNQDGDAMSGPMDFGGQGKADGSGKAEERGAGRRATTA